VGEAATGSFREDMDVTHVLSGPGLYMSPAKSPHLLPVGSGAYTINTGFLFLLKIQTKHIRLVVRINSEVMKRDPVLVAIVCSECFGISMYIILIHRPVVLSALLEQFVRHRASASASGCEPGAPLSTNY
jgi:hypothetical protein